MKMDLNELLWFSVWDMFDILTTLSLSGESGSTWDKIIKKDVHDHVFDVCGKYAKK